MLETADTVHLENAKIKHISEIMDMMEHFYAIDRYRFNPAQTRKNLKEFIPNKSLGGVWLVKAGEYTVGYVIMCVGYSFEFGGKDAFIDELYLKKVYRGKGYGQQVMALMEGEARNMQVKALHLEVELHNLAARSIYRKKGYTGKKSALLSKRLGN